MKNAISILLSLALLFGSPVNAALVVMLAGSPPSGVNMTVDLWQDFEFNTPADATAWQTALAANDHATGITWTISDGSNRFTISTSGQFTSPATINTLTDSGTRGLQSDATGTNLQARYLYATINQGTAPVSWGFWFFLPTLSVGLTEQPIASMFQGGAQITIKILADGSGNHAFRMTGTGDATTGTVAGNAWYYLSVLSKQNDTCKLRVYNTTGTIQGGGEITVTGNNQASNLILLGNVNTYLLTGMMYYDNLVANWTTATYPLIPW